MFNGHRHGPSGICLPIELPATRHSHPIKNAADQVELELAEDRALWKRIYWTAKEAGGTFRVRQHFQKLRTVTEATTGLVLTELAHIREVSESPHFDIGGDSATPDEAEMASLLITSTFHGSFRHKRLAFINALSANRIQLLTAGLRDEEWSVWTRTDDEQNPPISMPPNILGIDKNDVFLTDRPGTLQASKMEALIKVKLPDLLALNLGVDLEVPESSYCPDHQCPSHRGFAHTHEHGPILDR